MFVSLSSVYLEFLSNMEKKKCVCLFVKGPTGNAGEKGEKGKPGEPVSELLFWLIISRRSCTI